MAKKMAEPPVGYMYEIIKTEGTTMMAVTNDLARAVIAVAEEGPIGGFPARIGYNIFWLDTDGGRHHFNSVHGVRRVRMVLGNAARHAVLAGGWAARIHANRLVRPLTAALCPWEPYKEGSDKPHVVPLGVGTQLVSTTAIAALWRVSEKTLRKWLDSIGCPVVQSPAKGVYVNLIILEASLLRKDTGCTWNQAFNLLSTAHDLFRVYREQGWLDRLAALGSALLPLTFTRKSCGPRPSPPSQSPPPESPKENDVSSSTP